MKKKFLLALVFLSMQTFASSHPQRQSNNQLREVQSQPIKEDLSLIKSTYALFALTICCEAMYNKNTKNQEPGCGYCAAGMFLCIACSEELIDGGTFLYLKARNALMHRD